MDLYKLKERRRECEEIIRKAHDELMAIDEELQTVQADSFLVIKGSDVISHSRCGGYMDIHARKYIKVLPEAKEHGVLQALYRFCEEE